MKMLSLRNVLFLGLILSMVSCAKYEDGPLISFRTKTARLTGDWDLKVVKRNNIDQSQGNTETVMEFKDNGDFRSIETTNGDTDVETGRWEFANQGEKLEIIMDGEGTPTVFTVLRLKNTELWMEFSGTFLGETYIYEWRLEKK